MISKLSKKEYLKWLQTLIIFNINTIIIHNRPMKLISYIDGKYISHIIILRLFKDELPEVRYTKLNFHPVFAKRFQNLSLIRFHHYFNFSNRRDIGIYFLLLIFQV